MKRIPVTPRSDYREKIEALGFDFHGDYWREEAYYRFTAEETACLEEATNEAYASLVASSKQAVSSAVKR